MWKRLSRLWKKKGDDPGDATVERQPVEVAFGALGEAAVDQASAAVSDGERAIVAALERFDEDHEEIGPEAVIGRMRELVLMSPTDARVLRRAAALLRELGDEDLAAGFELAARSSSGEPLAELGHAFLGMDDAGLALALGDGAVERARERARPGRRRAADVDEQGDLGHAEGLLVGALALSRLGEHRQVLERLEGVLDASLAARVRWALGALALGDGEAFARIGGTLEEATEWVEAVRARVTAFPADPLGPRSDPQRLLFALYGALLLDDTEDGERVEPARLLRWMQALATLAREILPAGTRPAWVSPRGEVLARWLASLMPDDCAAMPLSARLPKQPVLVMLADDADLALLAETRAWAESELPTFQALKDPTEIGSPVADVVGVFRAGVSLPLEALEAERAADRVPPRMLVGRLQDEASRSSSGPVGPAELDGFLAWTRARASHLSLVAPPRAEARIPLDVAREI